MLLSNLTIKKKHVESNEKFPNFQSFAKKKTRRSGSLITVSGYRKFLL